jgi:hypothetical protein
MELRVERQFLSRGLEFYLLNHHPAGKLSLGGKVEFVELEEDMWAPQPTFGLSEAEAQALMDQPWQCGLRPSEGSGSAGSLAATERHLEDMRKLALHWCLGDEPGRPKP